MAVIQVLGTLSRSAVVVEQLQGTDAYYVGLGMGLSPSRAEGFLIGRQAGSP